MNKATKEVKTALLMLFGRDTNPWMVAGLTAVHGNTHFMTILTINPLSVNPLLIVNHQ